MESNELIAVGMFVRLKSKGFGKVTALWSENSPSGKVVVFAELQSLQVPHPLLPYHGASALQLKEEYEDVFLSKVEKRVVVEELSVFRKRSDFQQASDVFYIADFVTVEGVRLPEPPARIRPPPRAEKLQKWIAAHVTDKDVVELEKKPSILPADPPEPAAIVHTFKMASRNVVQATERNATSMPAKLPPPKGGKKGMVIDSDEEELQLMIEIGELPEKIDEEEEDTRPSKRSSRDHIEDKNPNAKKKAALDLEGSTKKKMLKKTTLKLEKKEDVESPFTGIDSKKDQKKEKFVKTPKFDFMKDDDEDEMYKYEDEVWLPSLAMLCFLMLFFVQRTKKTTRTTLCRTTRMKKSICRWILFGCLKRRRLPCGWSLFTCARLRDQLMRRRFEPIHRTSFTAPSP